MFKKTNYLRLFVGLTGACLAGGISESDDLSSSDALSSSLDSSKLNSIDFYFRRIQC